MRDLSFDQLSPAEVNFQNANGNFMIFNCSYFPDIINDSSNLITYLPASQKYIVDSLIINNLFDGLFTILNDSPIPVLRDAEYLEERTSDTTGFLAPISPSTASEICNENNITYLISFEYYSFSQEYNYYLDEDSDYYGFLQHTQKLIWRIYSKEGQLVDEYFQSDKFNTNEINMDYFQVQNNLYIDTSMLCEAVWRAGSDYGKKISPSWETVYRPIYEIREKTDSGTLWVSTDIKRLKDLSTSENKTKRWKACFNLAVLTESNGDIQNAIKWIELARSYKPGINISTYYELLKDRKKSTEMLDKQLGYKN